MTTLFIASARAAKRHSNALLQNGQFNLKNLNGSLQGWEPILPNEKIRIDSGGATISNPSAESVSGLRQTIAIKPEWTRILVRGEIKVSSPDQKTPAGVYMQWLGANGKTMPQIEPQTVDNGAQWLPITLDDPRPGRIRIHPGDPTAWTSVNCLLDTPKDAVALVISLQTGANSGDVSFKNFRVNGWILTLDDEFDGASVNPENWTVFEGPHYYNSGEKQWFDPKNVFVKDSNLIIQTDAMPHDDYRGSYGYHSGDIISRGKFQQLYGFFEFRDRVPMTVGAWPADVLLSWNDSWPPEIDVQELCSDIINSVVETNHYSSDDGSHDRSGPIFDQGSLDRSQWHTYAVAWEPDSISWYIDGVCNGEVHEPEDAKVSHVPMYITINTAVPGWYNDSHQGTWPLDFVTDYVHVYQRNDIPLPVYPKDLEEVTWPKNNVSLSAIGPKPNTGAVVTWSLAEGPGSATIENPHSLQTNATVSESGMYRFRITVSSGSTSTSDDQLVYVNRPL
jgi:beta-glucanase (GH16 family)